MEQWSARQAHNLKVAVFESCPRNQIQQIQSVLCGCGEMVAAVGLSPIGEIRAGSIPVTRTKLTSVKTG